MVNGTQYNAGDPQFFEQLITEMKHKLQANTPEPMTEQWEASFAPLENIDPNIYDGLMADIPFDELKRACQTATTRKAAGLSGTNGEELRQWTDSAIKVWQQIVQIATRHGIAPTQEAAALIAALDLISI